MSLREAWDVNAERWVRWAREPGHDSYWQFHRDRFFENVPPPGRLTLDVGCGEGRVSRDLAARGHHVVALDGSMTMARACATHQQPQPVAAADAACLPLRSGVADLVVAFMVMQDVDDLDGTVAETRRVLSPDGRLCLAVVHPLNSAGIFAGEPHDATAPFVIDGSYLDSFGYVDEVDRNGLPMAFHGEHRPIETYSRALEAAGFVTELIREVTSDDVTDRWCRIPLFLHIRAKAIDSAD